MHGKDTYYIMLFNKHIYVYRGKCLEVLRENGGGNLDSILRSLYRKDKAPYITSFRNSRSLELSCLRCDCLRGSLGNLVSCQIEICYSLKVNKDFVDFTITYISTRGVL